MSQTSAIHQNNVSLQILVVIQDTSHKAILQQALMEADHRAVALLANEQPLADEVKRYCPDAVILSVDRLGRSLLAQIRLIMQTNPLPFIVFTQHYAKDTAHKALKSGVSAYVVDTLRQERIVPILETALLRFQEWQDLRWELAECRIRLEERKLIERAKGVLMQRRGLSERDAYQFLRRTSMEHNLKIAKVAHTLLTLEETE